MRMAVAVVNTVDLFLRAGADAERKKAAKALPLGVEAYEH